MTENLSEERRIAKFIPDYQRATAEDLENPKLRRGYAGTMRENLGYIKVGRFLGVRYE